jgi:hypothetical protein
MYYLVTGSTDLTAGKPKRLKSWHFRATAAAVINLRNKSVTGDIVVPINLAITTSASQAYPATNEPVFPDGLYVEVVSGTVVGSVDL